MIEVVLTGKDLLARFRVVRIVERDHQAALGQGLWDQAPECGPEAIPGQFLRGHEGVIATLIDAQTKQRAQAAQQIRSA